MDAKKSTWVGGTVVLAVVLVAMAWFVLITPLRSSTAQASSDADAADMQNAKLSSQLVVLKQQATHLKEYQAERDDLRKVLPATAGLAEYMRSLEKLATDHDVTITAVASSAPVDVVVAADPSAAATPAAQAPADGDAKGDAKEGDSTKEAEAAGDAPATKPLGDVQVPGFVAMPFDITVVGAAHDVDLFVESVQKGNPRPLLVTAMTGSGQADQEAAGGRPETHEGDLELTVSGYIYVLQDTTAATATPDTDEKPAAPATLPKWPSDSPFTSGKS